MKEWIKSVVSAMIFGSSLALMAWSGSGLAFMYRDYGRVEKDLERIRAISEEAKMDAPEMADPEEGGSRVCLWRLARCQKSLEANEDTAGWISIEGTAVDYPVMRTPEAPDFYLSHGFDRQSSAGGMIVMDAGCGLQGGKNYLLYGHHMKNGTMFGQLERYLSPQFYRGHGEILFDTPWETGSYQVFSVFCLSGLEMEEVSECLMADTEEKFRKLIELAERKNVHASRNMPRWPERLLTLVTCEYTRENGRLFVMARRTGG